MAEENKAPVTALQDLIAGGIAGTASVVVGHPFDTYKVRLQTSAYGTKQSLNISNLFKGMGPPLSTAAVVNALIFSSYGESSRLYDQYFTSQGKGGTDEDNASTVVRIIVFKMRSTISFLFSVPFQPYYTCSASVFNIL
eukprot:532674_1